MDKLEMIVLKNAFKKANEEFAPAASAMLAQLKMLPAQASLAMVKNALRIGHRLMLSQDMETRLAGSLACEQLYRTGLNLLEYYQNADKILDRGNEVLPQ